MFTRRRGPWFAAPNDDEKKNASPPLKCTNAAPTGLAKKISFFPYTYACCNSKRMHTCTYAEAQAL